MSKIAGRHFFDDFWFGTGLGKFSWFYPQWQADYFKELSDIHAHNSFKGVGESYVILNEFLQLFLTVGAVGFSLILILIYKLLTAKSSRFFHLFFCLKSVIIGILVACFSSYPLHTNIILLYLLTCSSILLSLNENNYRFLFWKSFVNNFFSRSVCLISLGLCLIVTLDAWVKKEAVAEWQELKDEYSSFETAKHKYDQLYPVLKFDAKFLIDYGKFIIENDPSATPEKLVDAIGMLESAKQTLICKEGMEILAYGYWLNKNYNKAIEHFEWVSNFLPHLFAPKLALMKINLKLGNYKRAKDLSVWILTTPPKIPSKEVELIKIEAQSLVEQFNVM